MSTSSEFYNAVQGALKSWTALQLAVSHGFGGPYSAEKAQWLVGATETYFKENDNLEEWEIEEFLGQIMSEEFDTVLEDGSLTAIAKELSTLFGLWSKGNIEELRARTKNMPQVNLGECISQDPEDEQMAECSNEEEPMESLTLCDGADSSSTNQDSDKACASTRPTEDEDGWTTVVTRSKSKKKS